MTQLTVDVIADTVRNLDPALLYDAATIEIYNYGSCVYQADVTGKHCAVGAILKTLRPDLLDLVLSEELNHGAGVTTLRQELPHFADAVDDEAETLLERLQCEHDDAVIAAAETDDPQAYLKERLVARLETFLGTPQYT